MHRPEITIITTCMGRLAHLRLTLPTFLIQEYATCCVVDYSCPEHCGDWVNASYPAVKVVRVPGNSKFNASRARNLGAREATTPWLAFIDADMELHSTFCQAILPQLKPGYFFTPPPNNRGYSGTLLCRRDDFRAAGGYDELIRGWGYEDCELYERFAVRGVRRFHLKIDLLRNLTHDNSLRVAHYDEPEIAVSQSVNLCYSAAKLDLLRLTGRNIPQEDLSKLLKTVEATVRQVIATRASAGLEFEFKRRETLSGIISIGTLRYMLELRGNTVRPKGHQYSK